MKALEGGHVGGFCSIVARHGNINDASGGNIVRQENRGEFDLGASKVSMSGHVG